jgi:hypothetical protein
MRIRVGVAALAVSAAVYAAGPVLACGIDGVPSLSGNGSLAHLNTQRASAGSLGHWAPFVFVVPYRVRQTITFKENLADLHKSLLPQAFGHPWHWSFGDGRTAVGLTTHHSYSHAGVYKVVASAYYSDYKAWFEFDAALIHVR